MKFRRMELLQYLAVFLLGGFVASTLLLHHHVPVVLDNSSSSSKSHLSLRSLSSPTVKNRLNGLRILVVIVAFDFSQLPHLEEVLDGYHDVCECGTHIKVIIHATVPYPVTLIDLLNARLSCTTLDIQITLKPPSLRLFLVDEHRHEFYQHLQQYDLFVYTEDDHRVTPSILSSYLLETDRVRSLVQKQHSMDYNVGIVRYEYNYPSNVVMDDNTRHATQNVTRVYWEHSGFKRPVIGNAVVTVEDAALSPYYVSMQNHHQGMFLATREMLTAWKDRPNCDFANPRKRPGKSQPTEGTQRVWMSSHMLYGKRHCGVTQLLPKNTFGSLTVLHLPNKNYRRVGKYRKRKFSDGSEVFDQPHESLLSAMELHLALRREFPHPPQKPYRGIRMVDQVNLARDRTPLLERRMSEYQAYVDRGGVMSADDMEKVALVEDA